MNGSFSAVREKPGRKYLWYRAYALVVLVAWNAVGLWAWGKEDRMQYALMLMPLMLPALFMVFNLMAFKFRYSIFGPLERMPSPSEPVLEEVSATSGMIGLLHATWPFFRWELYPSGLGFCVHLVGCGFIPLGSIEKIKKGFLGGGRIWHRSPEIRSPVLVSDGRVTERLMEILGAAPGARVLVHP